MKQHTSSIAFPAASLVVIAVWAIGEAGVDVPAEVAAAITALVGYVAVLLGLSREQEPKRP